MFAHKDKQVEREEEASRFREIMDTMTQEMKHALESIQDRYEGELEESESELNALGIDVDYGGQKSSVESIFHYIDRLYEITTLKYVEEL